MGAVERTVERVVLQLVRRRLLVGATALLLLLAAAASASKVEVEGSIEQWFRKDDESLGRYHAFRKRFGADEFVLVVAWGDALLAPGGLQAVERIRVAAEALPQVARTRWLTNATVSEVARDDVVEVGPLARTLPDTAAGGAGAVRAGRRPGLDPGHDRPRAAGHGDHGRARPLRPGRAGEAGARRRAPRGDRPRAGAARRRGDHRAAGLRRGLRAPHRARPAAARAARPRAHLRRGPPLPPPRGPRARAGDDRRRLGRGDPRRHGGPRLPGRPRLEQPRVRPRRRGRGRGDPPRGRVPPPERAPGRRRPRPGDRPRRRRDLRPLLLRHAHDRRGHGVARDERGPPGRGVRLDRERGRAPGLPGLLRPRARAPLGHGPRGAAAACGRLALGPPGPPPAPDRGARARRLGRRRGRRVGRPRPAPRGGGEPGRVLPRGRPAPERHRARRRRARRDGERGAPDRGAPPSAAFRASRTPRGSRAWRRSGRPWSGSAARPSASRSSTRSRTCSACGRPARGRSPTAPT